MDLSLDRYIAGDTWAVTMTVNLDRRETGELFLIGDKLICWPDEGMVAAGTNTPFDRSSMFLSEIVSRPRGLELRYETEEQAERAAGLLALQVRSALPLSPTQESGAGGMR